MCCKLAGASAATLRLLRRMSRWPPKRAPTKKTHFVTLSFDDGFKKSSIRTAEIYEKYKLSACINVIATAHLPDFVLPNEYHRWPVGDFGLWNELQSRGHEIMPHGYKHANKRELPLAESQDLDSPLPRLFHQGAEGIRREEVRCSIFRSMRRRRQSKSGLPAR